MTKVNKLIVGGGLTSLIWGLFNPDSVIITDGEIKQPSYDPFIFLHDNSDNKSLCNAVGIDPLSTKVDVVFDQDLHTDSVIINKLAGVGNSCRQQTVGTDTIAGISQGMVLRAIAVNLNCLFNKIVNILESRNQILKTEIGRIDSDTLVTKDGGFYEWSDFLVSTLHFKRFSELCSCWSCDYSDVKTNSLFFQIESYSGNKNRIHYLNDGTIHKVVYNSITGKKGIEYSPNTSELPEGVIEVKDIRCVGNLSPPPEKVLFCGRSATANGHWRIEDSVFMANGGWRLSVLLSKQKRFDIQVKRLAKAKNPNYGLDLRLKDLALHLVTEVSELLREIEWKTNKPKKNVPIKLTTVLEELIDILKLDFAIFNEFDYTEREFYSKFLDKDSKNWLNLVSSFYGGV